MRFFEALRTLDWTLIITALLLAAIGLAMIFSASYDAGKVLSYRFTRQTAALATGCISLLLIARLPYVWWKRYAIALYIAGIISLILVSLTGQVIRGTTSRLIVATVQIQPSEFMRIGLVVMLAYLFSRRQVRQLKTTIVSAFVVGLPTALLLLEPDAGMAILIAGLWMLTLILIGIPWSRILFIMLIGLIIAAASWQWLLFDYQKDRLSIFLNPSRDPLGAGYNVTQSIVALGSGEFSGRGLGHGPQSRLQFLPEQHTDFIFASIGEELGFIGISLMIILYSILLWRILRIAERTKDIFGRLLATGTFSLLLLSCTISAGMNVGLLPVTGLPLPLVSYGGSSILSTFILLGIVESVAIHSRWTQAPPGEISQLT